MANRYITKAETDSRRKNDLSMQRLEARLKIVEAEGGDTLPVLKEINRILGRQERQEAKRQARLAPKVQEAVVAVPGEFTSPRDEQGYPTDREELMRFVQTPEFLDAEFTPVAEQEST